MALNGLHMPVHAPWYSALRSELLSFPAGKHDDQVDALGLVGQFLDRMTAGSEPIVWKPKLIPSPGYILLPGPPSHSVAAGSGSEP